MQPGRERLDRAIDNAAAHLMALRNERGHWRGQLSSSALSTATAAGAMAMVDADAHGEPIARALDWIANHANDDGGWGDCPQSPSNIATTLVTWSAFALAGAEEKYPETMAAAGAWLRQAAGSLGPADLADAVARRYGDDATFAAPILTMCALAGRLGDEGWSLVPALPFEAALLPHRILKWLRLPVVSYALPALIAIGQVRHHHLPPANPAARIVRNLARKSTRKKLIRIQPASGGFLEAAPLTAFVTMSLAAMGCGEHPAARGGMEFLLSTVRADGSWPIDTDLATWVTTHAVGALAAADLLEQKLPQAERETIRRWLLDQQHTRRHPYTQADPGGWAWTDLSGGVPDADDTPSTMLALRKLGPGDEAVCKAARDATVWLLSIRNNDFGIPTFCRGWGRLDFDRSSSDLTAHTMRAWAAWRGQLSSGLADAVDFQINLAAGFLVRSRREDGAWVPLWFGNQQSEGQTNGVFGTGRVVLALAELAQGGYRFQEMLEGGCAFLLAACQESGGWGGEVGLAASIEETAVAVEALAAAGQVVENQQLRDRIVSAVRAGADWLVEATEGGKRFPASPIGLYFARLWYSEAAYPLVFSLAAWGRARNLLRRFDV